jgi:hypothetical protein
MAHSGQNNSAYHNWASFAQPAPDLQLEREHDFLQQQASGFSAMVPSSQPGYQYYPSQAYHQQHIGDAFSIASNPARTAGFHPPISSGGGGTTAGIHAAASSGSHAISSQQHVQPSYPHTAGAINPGAVSLNTSPHNDSNTFTAATAMTPSPMGHLYSQIPASTDSDLQRSTERMTALMEENFLGASGGYNHSLSNGQHMPGGAQTGRPQQQQQQHQRTVSSTSPATSPTRSQFNKNNNSNNHRVFAAVPARAAFNFTSSGASDQRASLAAAAAPREIPLSQQRQLQRHVSGERKPKRFREEGDENNEEDGGQKEGDKSEK